MRQPRLCVSLTAATTAELRARRDKVRDADLVELRLDSVSDPDVAGVLADRTCKVVVTCRAAREGGLFRGSEEERFRILSAALDMGADYIDVEWRAGFDTLIRRENGRRIILSMHDFSETPSDLADRYRAMRATGAEIVKLAVHTKCLSDLVPLLSIGRMAGAGEQVALVGMGPAGVPSRILAARFGSCLTYAGDGVAPGQLPPERLLGEFRFRSLTENCDVYGVVGSPIAHSLSPAMHNAAFEATGLNGAYVPLAAKDANDFLDFAAALPLSGASITAPFKQDLFRLADEVEEIGRRVGAINTLRNEAGKWHGTNTDVPGFLAPLDGLFPIAGSRTTIVGAGGAARAVAVALASRGARVTIRALDIEITLAGQIAAMVGGEAGPLPPPPGTWDLLINATPVGTYPKMDESALEGAVLDGQAVYDLVYNPAKTRLLRDAEAAGCMTVGGLDMLVAQAQLQFEWWTGQRVASSVMKEAATKRLREMEREDKALHETHHA